MALLVATTIDKVDFGNRYGAMAQIPAASNADTWDAAVAGISAITFAISSPNDASTVAADSCSITWSGSVVTFNVAGTARAQALLVYGRGTSGRV